jgi:hypothetical protein
MSEVEHGVKDTFYDNLGRGWRMQCFCGYMTGANNLQFSGEEMDEHFVAEADLVE